MKIRKMLLRPLAVFMVACMLLSLGGISAANDETEVEIIVCGVECPQKAQQIINSINGEIGISPMSVFCLFGHSLAQGVVIVTEHRFWSTAPRCRQTIYSVTYCTRSSCNYNVATIISQGSVPCCA